MTIEWKDSYRIGDDRIDQQHQQLFELAADMLEAQDQAALRLCAIRLYKHVRRHFADEEALMRKIDYPGYRKHVEAHETMLRRLHQLSLAIGNNQIDAAVVTSFINEWALKHIPVNDAQLAEFIKR